MIGMSDKSAQRFNYPPKIGPLGVRSWNGQRWIVTLTDEGKRRLDEWMLGYPLPSSVLHAHYRGLVRHARDCGLDDDDIDGICLSAVCRAMSMFDPARGCVFVSLATHYMCGHLRRAAKEWAKHEWYGLRRVSGERLLTDGSPDGGHNYHLFGAIEARQSTHPVADYRRRMRAAVESLIESRRDQEILLLHFGLAGGDPMTAIEVADTFDADPSEVEDVINHALKGKLRPLVAEIEDENLHTYESMRASKTIKTRSRS